MEEWLVLLLTVGCFVLGTILGSILTRSNVLGSLTVVRSKSGSVNMLLDSYVKIEDLRKKKTVVFEINTVDMDE